MYQLISNAMKNSSFESSESSYSKVWNSHLLKQKLITIFFRSVLDFYFIAYVDGLAQDGGNSSVVH